MALFERVAAARLALAARGAAGAIGLAVIVIGFAVMAITSRWTYTSLGFDLESMQGASDVKSTYLRWRWTADGSFWIGGSAHLRPLAERPIEAFDLGGRFFQRRPAPVARTEWQRRGFWYVDGNKPDPFGTESAALWRWWVGCPAWLPALLSLAAWLWIRRGPRRQSIKRPASR